MRMAIPRRRDTACPCDPRGFLGLLRRGLQRRLGSRAATGGVAGPVWGNSTSRSASGHFRHRLHDLAGWSSRPWAVLGGAATNVVATAPMPGSITPSLPFAGSICDGLFFCISLGEFFDRVGIHPSCVGD